MRALLPLRSLLFVVLLPGTVAGYIPLRILTARGQLSTPALSATSVLAACVIAIGAFVLLRCVWDFLISGRGTLAPIDPPRHLVVRGLYRFTRNPMYNGVVAALVGEAWLFRSVAVLQYAALVFVMFQVFVMVYEEPALEAKFGESYRAYKARVPRWGFTLRSKP